MNLSNLLFRFQGRIGRKQFWYSYLPVLVIGTSLDLYLKFSVMPSLDAEKVGAGPTAVELISLLLVGILLLVAAYVAFAVLAKRWHDRGKSGWWSLITLIPLLGTIWILIECGFLPGTIGPNRFGPDPLAEV